MSKKIFTEQEILELSKNKYVKNVTAKGITYTNEFKLQFIAEYENGKTSRAIFEDAGFDVNIIGIMKPGSSVGWGGSDTLNKIGIKEELYKRNFKVIDRDQAKDAEEKYKLERDCFYADYYLMSTNAMTEDGILVNMDGHCNRVSCLCFGPRHIIMIVGMNKVTKDLDSAISRLRNVAAPINNQRFSGNRPCQLTGSCANCLAQGCICDQLVITRNSMESDRIHVILVDEVLGY